MNYNIIAYSIYIPVTIALSIWIAKSLHRNTKAFLIEKFNHNDSLATSTNNLIQTGFYLIALGFSFMKMHIGNFQHSLEGKMWWDTRVMNGQETIEQLASKLGAFTLVLGVLLFLNFFIMLIIQKPKKQQQSNFVVREVE
ncbi:MAG: hypothetical protein K0S32_3303 [Bacteroidetes bacterium]|jgi:hypothetical protein|nr:hypothetical protein [Bacteroidota bacterium]